MSALDVLLDSTLVDLSLENQQGFNALHLAAMKGNAYSVKAILAKDPSLANKAKPGDGFAPLHVATLNGREEVTKVLLGKVDVNAKDQQGRTALHYAALQGYYKMVELLLHNGTTADPNVGDDEGDTPLHLALAMEGTPDTAKSLESAIVPDVMLSQIRMAAVPEGLQKWVAIGLLLILNGAEANIRNKRGLSCFDQLHDVNARALLFDMAVKSPQSETQPQAQVTCQICKQVTIPVVFQPCGHKIVCNDCSKRMVECLSCQVTLTEKQTSDSGFEASSSSTMRVKALEGKLKELEDQCYCTICMERVKNIVFLCGHGACSECVETLTSCHMCRGHIKKKIHLY